MRPRQRRGWRSERGRDPSSFWGNVDQGDLRIYKYQVRITFDPTKRAATLEERGLDFTEAPEVFAGTVIDIPDRRVNYGEDRVITIGLLRARMVVVVWTSVGEDARRIISMRKANDREQRRFGERLRQD